MKCLAITTSAISLFATGALAQETPVSNEETETIVVTSFGRDYLANKGQTSAVGLDLTQLETPAAISVISQDLLKDQQVNNVDDALRNVAGVTKFKTGNGGEEKFSIRGFDASQSIYKDGARINNANNASNIPSTETANLERIEVLKGPSALLYGQGQPGGIINYITKKPELARSTSLEFIGGSFDFYKFEGDTTGAVPGTNEQLAYRLVVAYEDSESFRNEVARERLLVNPTLAWSPNERFNLLLGYEYIDDNYTQDRGQVLDGNAIDGYRYSNRQDEEQFFGIPGWNENSTTESTRFYAIANAQVTDFWRVEAIYSQTENDKTNFDSSQTFLNFADGTVIGPIGGDPGDENIVAIQPRKSIGTGETSQVTVRNFLNFTDGLGFDHEILASYTFEEFKTESTIFRGRQNVEYNIATGEYSTNLSAIDTTDPTFVQPTSTIGFILQDRGSDLRQDFEEQGFNVLDYITLNDQWAVLIGGRYSEFENGFDDFEDDNFSLRGGVVYTPLENLSFYASYSEGYSPSGGFLDLNDEQVDPETSVSYEAGAKLALRDERLLITTAIFSVTEEGTPFIVNPFDEEGNLTPSTELRFDNIGEIETSGFEIEIVGQLTDDWRVQGGYSYQDNEITKGAVDPSDTTFTPGNTLPGIAENSFNVFTFYEVPVADGDLGIGGGLFYQDEVFISTANEGTYQEWAQVDLASYYKRENWKLQLNISNLFDEQYRQAQAGTTSDPAAAIRVGTAAPRKVIASFAVEF